jgi:glycosyltransferase involved in cell wall biosynthesis
VKPGEVRRSSSRPTTRRPCSLEAIAASLGIGRSAIFPGRIADGDLPALYADAAVFVLPSLEEGFGLSALEAMAYGTPVVVSDRGALPELVADAGLVVDAESERAPAFLRGERQHQREGRSS